MKNILTAKVSRKKFLGLGLGALAFLVVGLKPVNALIFGSRGSTGDTSQLALESGGNLAKIPGLSIPIHDYVLCSYTGDDLTGVVYKTGGGGGSTVATLTLVYSSGKLQSVTKT